MKNFDFVLLRVECCNMFRNAPCNLALVGVRSGEISEEKQFLINPGDAPFDFLMSGLQLSDLRDYPTFKEQWPQIEAFIRQYPLLVPSADGYDVDVLHNALSGIEYQPIPYVTAKNICRRSLNTYSFSYEVLCKTLGLDPADYNPLNLARSWANIVCAALSKVDYDNLDAFFEDKKFVVGSISSAEFVHSYMKRIEKPKKNSVFEADPEYFDPTNLFYDQNVVFTGKLTYFTRDEAEEEVLKIGGHIQNNLTKTTNYLVVGEQNPSVVGPDGLSSKQRKAKEYREQGLNIEFLTENEFIDIMHLEARVEATQFVEELSRYFLPK